MEELVTDVVFTHRDPEIVGLLGEEGITWDNAHELAISSDEI